jgi:hypothetical protein
MFHPAFTIIGAPDEEGCALLCPTWRTQLRESSLKDAAVCSTNISLRTGNVCYDKPVEIIRLLITAE